MGLASGTLKFAVFVLNFLLVCLGFAMVLFGALDSPIPNELDHFEEIVKEVSLTSKVLIIAGTIIFVIAFFGCWGAVSDSSWMLFLYALFLMVLVLAEAAIGVYVYLNQATVKENTTKALKTWIKEYDQQASAKNIIDTIQSKWQCCGVTSKDDWRTRLQGIPPSCCLEKSTNAPCPTDSAFSVGCLTKGVNFISEAMKKYVWVVGAVIGIEVLTILFALIARNSILNEERRSYA